MRPRRVLVTGAAGFVGSALLAELRRTRPDDRITAVRRRDADLSDAAAARRLVDRVRPDLVFHLAGTRPPASAPELWTGNVATTLNLGAALARRAPGARLVVAGSCAEYGAGPSGPVSETYRGDPQTPYARAKMAQSLAAASFSHEGLDVRVAVIFNLLGPGTPAALAPGAFASRAVRLEGPAGGTIPVGALATRRDYLDVRDAARALALLGFRPRLSGRYNVCSGRAVPTSEVLRLTLAAVQGPVRAVRNPALTRGAGVRGILGSTRRLRRATGWRPRISLERSVAETVAWHRRAALGAA